MADDNPIVPPVSDTGASSGSNGENPPAEGGRSRRRRSAKQSSWMAHVKATMRAHRGMKLKQVLKIAGKTYKKAMRGGSALTPAPAGTRSPDTDPRSIAGSMSGGRYRGKTRRSRRRHA